MDITVRGTRSSTQDWVRAQQLSANELPPLDEQQETEARLTHRSNEDYARSAYAGQLSQQRLLREALKFGRWLNSRIQERNPDSLVEAVELNTWSGKLLVRVAASSETVEFEIDEDLVERFLATGSAELERSIFRLLEINLPQQREARAS